MDGKFILVGSTYFFDGMDGFHSKDKDFVQLVDKPNGFQYVKQTSGSYCLFQWKRMSADEFVEYALAKGPAMQLGKFLVPEFVIEIDFTIAHLRRLKPLVDALDEKHAYERVIYNAYLENGGFRLTAEQREQAYEAYKQARETVKSENYK